MTFQDLFITPVYLFLFSLIAYLIRPYVTTSQNRKYFLPALWIKFFGAIMLGVIYQFHYGGGDTFNYFTNGSRWIWEAFLSDPGTGISLLLESGGPVRSADTFSFSQHIWFYKDPQSFMIVRITGFFDLFTFHTYSATALFFAAFSFSGLWALYDILCRRYPFATSWLAIGMFFIPSTFFWGSGILKDTITLGALGWLTYAVYAIVETKKKRLLNVIVLLLSVLLISAIKVYILLCILPMIAVWLFLKSVKGVQNTMLKVLVAPFFLIIFMLGGYLVTQQLSQTSERYQLDAIAERAAITAYDIRYGWGARVQGDGGYDLGVLDGSWQGMIRLIPQGIVVSIFRPFPWEVRNPLMLLAALESLFFSFMLVRFLSVRGTRNVLFSDPFLMFSLMFALLFAFAVGVSTFNFGSLMRYKIPMVPFYFIALIVPIEAMKLKKAQFFLQQQILRQQ